MKRAILVATAVAAICTTGQLSNSYAGHGFGGFGGGGSRGSFGGGGGGRQYGSSSSRGYWGGNGSQNYSHGYNGGNYAAHQSYQPSTAHYSTNSIHSGNVTSNRLSTTKTVKYQPSSKANKAFANKSNPGKSKPGGRDPDGKRKRIAGLVNGALGALQTGDSDGGDDSGSAGIDGDQQASDGDSQSADVATAAYQVDSSDSSGGSAQPVVNVLPNSADGQGSTADSSATVKVINPSETGQTVNYVLGSESSSLVPGTANIHAQVSQEIIFDRGGSFGVARYTLGPGTYRFVASDNGWDLRTVRE